MATIRTRSASMDPSVNSEGCSSIIAAGKEVGSLSEERRLGGGGPGDLKGEVIGKTTSSLPQPPLLSSSLSSQNHHHDGSSLSEPLRIELLRLGMLMIEFLSANMVDHRKELIKFAWNHLRADDSISKQWAYINVCRFISVYDTPSKIILQAS